MARRLGRGPRVRVGGPMPRLTVRMCGVHVATVLGLLALQLGVDPTEFWDMELEELWQRVKKARIET